MGIYSGIVFNEGSRITCETADGYTDMDTSAQVIMIENCENNLKLFEGGIVSDIQEAAMRINGVDSYEIISFNENVITDMLGKIKSMFMKLWAKIKAIFKGFMARVDSVFMKSGKSLVNKYKSVILKKDMTDFEAKWRRPKGANHGIADMIEPFTMATTKGTTNLDMKTYTDPKETLEKWDDDKVREDILKSVIKGNPSFDIGEFEKEFMDSLFEDEDVDDKIDIDDIMTQLTTFKDTKKGCEKANNSLNKSIADMVKQFEKNQSEFIKERPGLKTVKISGNDTEVWGGKERKQIKGTFGDWNRENPNREGKIEDSDGTSSLRGFPSGSPSSSNTSNKDDVNTYQKQLNIVVKYAHVYQDCATKYTAAIMKAFKFQNSQLRRVFAKAVAYNRKKDESVMMEAFADLAEYEADVV